MEIEGKLCLPRGKRTLALHHGPPIGQTCLHPFRHNRKLQWGSFKRSVPMR
jgi:hypothetical protein